MTPKRTSFNEDFWVKACSLILAVMIWVVTPRDTTESIWGRERWNPFQAVVRTESRTFREMPITVLTAADDSRGFQVFPSVVSVTVSGEQNALRSVLPEEIEVYVNLTDVVEANGLRKQIRARVPGGMQVLKLDPSSVEVKIGAQTTGAGPGR